MTNESTYSLCFRQNFGMHLREDKRNFQEIVRILDIYWLCSFYLISSLSNKVVAEILNSVIKNSPHLAGKANKMGTKNAMFLKYAHYFFKENLIHTRVPKKSPSVFWKRFSLTENINKSFMISFISQKGTVGSETMLVSNRNDGPEFKRAILKLKDETVPNSCKLQSLLAIPVYTQRRSRASQTLAKLRTFEEKTKKQYHTENQG